MDQPGWLITVLPTITALAIAVFGFFKEPILDWLFAPVLSISLDRPKTIPFLLRGPWTPVWSGFESETIVHPAHWLHLAVANEGWRTARQTQILVERLMRQTNGEMVEVPEFLQMCLEWSHSGTPPKVALDLPPNFTRRANLAHAAKLDTKQLAEAQAEKVDTKRAQLIEQIMRDSLLVLHTEVNPSNGCNILEPGVYEVHLLVAAENCRPKRTRFRIDFRSGWSDDPAEFAKSCLVVTPI